MHCHPSSPAKGAFSFKERDGILHVCNGIYARTMDLLFLKSHSRRLDNVQLIPYSRELQQKEHQEWESNLCPSASTGSHVQPTSARLTCLNFVSWKFWFRFEKKKAIHWDIVWIMGSLNGERTKESIIEGARKLEEQREAPWLGATLPFRPVSSIDSSTKTYRPFTLLLLP